MRPSLRDLTTWIGQCVGRDPEDGANPFLAATVDFVAVVGAGDGCDVGEHVDDQMTGGAGRHDGLGGDGAVAAGREFADPEGHSFLHPLFYSHWSRDPSL